MRRLEVIAGYPTVPVWFGCCSATWGRLVTTEHSAELKLRTYWCDSTVALDVGTVQNWSQAWRERQGRAFSQIAVLCQGEKAKSLNTWTTELSLT